MKILKSSLVIVAAAAMVGSATWAFFSKPLANEGNTFSTTNLHITLNQKGDPGWNGQLMNVTDMAPGTFAEAGASIDNAGKMPFVATLNLTSWPGNFGVGDVAIVTIWREGHIIYNGPLSGLYNNELKLFQVNPTTSQYLSYRIELPDTVDNNYQDQTISNLVFTITAYQPNDPHLNLSNLNNGAGAGDNSNYHALQSYGVFGFIDPPTPNYVSMSNSNYSFMSYTNFDATTWMSNSADAPPSGNGPFAFPW